MMRGVLDGLLAGAERNDVLAVHLAADGSVAREVTYRETALRAARLGSVLQERGLDRTGRVGLVAGNSPEWLFGDLALLHAGVEEVPVPLTFSAQQAAAMLRGVDACLVDAAGNRALAAWGLAAATPTIDLDAASAVPDHLATPALSTGGGDEDIVKTIHTSGTTGLPKGVRLRRAGIEALLESLARVTPDGVYRRFLSLVPLSLLIEQVVAVYLPILQGGHVVFLPEHAHLLGTAGSSADDAVGWLRSVRPTAAVLPPAAVSALDKHLGSGGADRVLGPGEAPFLMAGGAPVDPAALRRLDAAGVPIYEGYGLSENGSVVSWNRPGAVRYGTAGRPLPHCEVRTDEHGELLVRSSSMFAGYSVEDPTSKPVDEDGWLHTGDRAEIDADGYIRLLGRLKNTIITANGRNVSPEWVESRLRHCASVTDAVVFGDGLEHLVALVLSDGSLAPERTEREVLAFGHHELGEVDRPQRVLVVPDTPALREAYFTVTGRPRRERLFEQVVRPALTPDLGAATRS